MIISNRMDKIMYVNNNEVLIHNTIIKKCVDHAAARRYARHELDEYLGNGYIIEYNPPKQWIDDNDNRQLKLTNKRMDSLVN